MIVLEIIGLVIIGVLGVALAAILIVLLVPLAILIVVGAIAGVFFGIGLYIIIVMYLIELYRDSRRERKKLPRDIEI